MLAAVETLAAAGTEIRADSLRLDPLVSLDDDLGHGFRAHAVSRADTRGQQAEKNPTEDHDGDAKSSNTPHATSHALRALPRLPR